MPTATKKKVQALSSFDLLAERIEKASGQHDRIAALSSNATLLLIHIEKVAFSLNNLLQREAIDPKLVKQAAAIHSSLKTQCEPLKQGASLLPSLLEEARGIFTLCEKGHIDPSLLVALKGAYEKGELVKGAKNVTPSNGDSRPVATAAGSTPKKGAYPRNLGVFLQPRCEECGENLGRGYATGDTGNILSKVLLTHHKDRHSEVASWDAVVGSGQIQAAFQSMYEGAETAAIEVDGRTFYSLSSK